MKFKATAEFEWDKNDLLLGDSLAGFIVKHGKRWSIDRLAERFYTKHQAQRALEAALGIERVEDNG